MSETIALIAGIAAYLLYRKRVHRADNQKPPNTQIGQSTSISRGLFSPVSALSDLDVPHLMQYPRNGSRETATHQGFQAINTLLVRSVVR